MHEKLAQLRIPGPDGESVPISAPPGIPQGGENTLEAIISVGLQIFLIVVVLVSLVYLLWAGIKWIQSEGDPQKVDAARKQVIFAIIGLSVAFGAFAVMNILGGVFGISFF